MKNLSKSEKALLIIMLTCGIMFVYYRYFLSPILKDIASAGENIVTLQNQKDNLSIVKLSNKNLTKEIDALKVKFSEAAKSLPQTERNPELIYEFKKMGDPNKVIVKSVDIPDVKEYTEGNNSTSKEASSSNGQKTVTKNSGKLMIYPVIITVTGDYNSIMNYTKAVESASRIAQVTDLSIKRYPGTQVLEGRLIINYYFVDLNLDGDIKYEFNTGTYGKPSLF